MTNTKKLLVAILIAVLCVTLSIATIVTFGNNATTADNADVAIAGSSDSSADVNANAGIATAVEQAVVDHNTTWVHGQAQTVPKTGGTLRGGSSAEEPTYYYLESDVELTSSITISGYVELCLNGYMLKGTGSDSVIKITSSGANLTLFDCCKGIGCSTSAHRHSINSKTIYGGVITGGNASYGGGVCITSGTFTMNGGTIYGNTASKYGGGVYFGSSGTFTMNGGTISNNTTSGEYNGYGGGGVYVTGGTFTMNGGTISNNTASGESNGYGGGVYVTGGTFTMDGGTISNNTASGGSYYSNGGGVYLSGSKSTFTMNGCTISGNSANSGGGVYVASGTFTMTGGTISGNTAEYGAGMYVASGTFTMNDSTISGNKGCTRGGGVYVDKGTFTMNGGKISNHTTSDFGGGVCLSGSSSKFTMDGGTISGNKAEFGAGVLSYGTFTMENGTISSNTCTGSSSYGGGGVSSFGTFTMENGTISGNNGNKYGGGVYVYGGTFTMKDGTISDNTASESGAGVFSGYSGATFIMNGGTISGNTLTSTTSTYGGGGVYSGATFIMNGGTISGNKASRATHCNGGGVYFHDGTFEIGGAVNISGNTKSSDDSDNNVYLSSSNRKITITGSLTDAEGNKSSCIGLSYNNIEGILTSGYSEYNEDIEPYAYFFADNGKDIILSSGETYLRNTTHTHVWETLDEGDETSPRTQQVACCCPSVESKTRTLELLRLEVSVNEKPNVGDTELSDITVTAYFKVLGDGSDTVVDTVVLSSGDYEVVYHYTNGEYFTSGDSAEISYTIGNVTKSTTVNVVTVHKHEGVTFEVFSGTTDGTTTLSSGKYYLTQDFTGNLTISGTVELCLNGYVLKGTGSASVIYISSSSASLTLHDCCVGEDCETAEHQHLINDTTIYGGVITGGTRGVYAYGTFTMNGGTIFGNNTSSEGGGVSVYRGTFTMTGGTIFGNTASNEGGGVYVQGTFKVSGAVNISGNTKSSDDSDNNVYLYSSSFKITIIGALTDEEGNEAIIGVSHSSSTATLTSGYSTYNKGIAPSTYFFADNGCDIVLQGNEAYLTNTKHTHSYVWETLDDGDETSPRTQQGVCSCNDTTTRTLELLRLEVSVNEKPNVGDTELSDITVTAYFKVLGDDSDTVVDTVVLSSGDYEIVYNYTNGEYFTSGDSAEISYTIGSVTKNATVEIVTAHKHDGVTFEVFSGTANGTTTLSGGKYYLDKDFTGNLTITGTVELCLNGYMLKGTGSTSVITINSSANLTLHDCCKGEVCETAEHQHIINDTTIYGGVITGGSSSSMYVYSESNAKFTMNGGTIFGNTASDGDGVYVSSGTFTMNGGTISGNTATRGSGVRVINGTFTMNDGTISGNTSMGVEVSTGATFIMTGGTITGNKIGVYVGYGSSGNGIIKIRGACKIWGNNSTNVQLGLSSIKINIIGKLTDEEGNKACIGVTPDNTTGVFTSGYSTYNQGIDPSTYFFADNGCAIELSSNEAYLTNKAPHVHSFDGPYINDSEKGQHYQLCSCNERQYSEHYVVEGSNYTDEDNHDDSGHWKLCVCGEHMEYQEHSTDDDDFKSEQNHDQNGHWLICNVCNAKYNEVTHDWNGQWQPGDGNHYQECSVCKQRYEQEHKWGDWEIDVAGDETTARTQKLTCSDCNDVQTRELKLVSLKVEAKDVYKAKQVGLVIEQVTANFVVVDDEETEISFVLESREYALFFMYNNNSYFTTADTYFEVVYEIGEVRISERVNITVNPLTDATGAITSGSYSRTDWHEGQAPASETNPTMIETASIKYYKDAQANVEYVGGFNASTPAGTYYAFIVIENDPDYAGTIKEQLGEFTVTAHNTESSSYADNHNESGHWLVCSECSAELSKVEHAWDGEWQITKDTHYQTCDICQEVKTVNHVSDGGKVTQAATCTATGEKTYSCEDCNAVLNKEVIDIIDHERNEGVVTKDATCTATGVKTFSCKVCKAPLGTEVVQMLEHERNDGVITKDATCTATGVKTYSCKVCEAVLGSEVVAMIDHNTEGSSYADNHNESAHWLVCSECGAEVDKVSHVWDGEWLVGESNHYQECAECGQVKAEDHSWNNWTANEDKHERACDKCEAVETFDHSYDGTYVNDEAMDKHYQECEICGYKKYEDHIWNDGVVTSDATAEEDGVRTFTCEKCGATKTEPIPATGEVEVPKDDPTDAPVKDPSNSDPAEEPEEKKIDLVIVIAIAIAAVLLIAAIVAITAKKKSQNK